MSIVGEDMLAHSYFAQDSSALLDLVTLFWKNPNPPRRCGIRAIKDGLETSAWKYFGGICQDARLLGLIAALRDKEGFSTTEIKAFVNEHFRDGSEANSAAEALQAILMEG